MRMMISLAATVFLFNSLLMAQHVNNSDSSYIIQLNQQIDNEVVKRNVVLLDSLFAEDFVMTHGDGRRDKKSVWLNAVVKSNYSVRRHDSVKVELHANIAVVKGKMLVEKAGGEATAVPYRSYIRVFAIRNNYWQLLSHFTMYDK